MKIEMTTRKKYTNKFKLDAVSLVVEQAYRLRGNNPGS